MYSLNSVIYFGKYYGYPLNELIEEDFSYVTWAIANIESFRLDDTAKKAYRDKLIENENIIKRYLDKNNRKDSRNARGFNPYIGDECGCY